jgi:uncharacterized membrane protein (UPF0182 family)
MRKIQFFLWWLLVGSTCIYIGMLLSRPLADFLYAHNVRSYSASNDGFFEGALSFLLSVGFFMGLGQWLVINAKIKRVYGWILATLIGFSAGSFISFIFFAFISSIIKYDYHRFFDLLSIIGTGAGAGIITGICQWISLRRKMASAIKWSLVMALSFTISIIILTASSVWTSFSESGLILSIIVISLISGLFVEKLIIQPEIRQKENAI